MNAQTDTLIFSPAEAAKLAFQTLEDLRQSKTSGLKTGIAPLDKVMMPMRPGDLISVLGYTSWYKSGLMNWFLKSACPQCLTGDVVVKVTWEDSVEEETLRWISADAGVSVSSLIRGDVKDWSILSEAYKNRLQTPLWIVGHSSQLNAQSGRTRPRLTMTDTLSAVQYIASGATDQKYRVRLIVLDYLQRIRPDRGDGETRREQMMEAVNRAKDLAVQVGCPVVLGVQTGRQVLDRESKQPQLDDGAETSNIEQSSTAVLSVWYPIKTEEVNDVIDIAGQRVKVTPNILAVSLLKQKLGPAPVTLPLYVDPERNIVAGLQP